MYCVVYKVYIDFSVYVCVEVICYLKILHFHPEARNVPASENLSCHSPLSLLHLTTSYV